MRRRKGQPVHGWLILDKPAGISSAAAVGQVKRLLDAEKIGHAGTLDPLASGILPLALGEATKTVSYVMSDTKRYRFTVRWGEARSTDDVEGEVTATSEHRPDTPAILGALSLFAGVIQQTPPAYSAIKIDGKRAYALARKGEAVELAPREVTIDRLELLGANGDSAEFDLVCGKGTYVRSLARDLAMALGTVGHVTALRRTAVGRFDEIRAIALDSLVAFGHSAGAFERVLPILTVLDDIPALAITEAEAKLIQTGRSVWLGHSGLNPGFELLQGNAVCVTGQRQPVALGQIVNGEFRPVRVFNL
jgi:tRNA pseudouridine55 synthase